MPSLAVAFTDVRLVGQSLRKRFFSQKWTNDFGFLTDIGLGLRPASVSARSEMRDRPTNWQTLFVGFSFLTTIDSPITYLLASAAW